MAPRFLSSSCAATVFMGLYVTFAALNLYKLMYPLSMIDISTTPPESSVRPLWPPRDDKMHMRVYLSTKQRFNLGFLRSEFSEDAVNNDVALLWDKELTQAAFSKSFLLTTLSTDDDKICNNDESFRYAQTWLDDAEKTAADRGEGGVLATISAAGQGIESTSILLTLYQSISKQLHSLLVAAHLVSADKNVTSVSPIDAQDASRQIVKLPSNSDIWKSLQSNSTVYIHVLVLRNNHVQSKWPPTSLEEGSTILRRASQTSSVVAGQVDMVKYAPPDHIVKPKRVLVHDVTYALKNMLFLTKSSDRPPWDMEYSKPKEYAMYKKSVEMKENNVAYPYWKPEVSIKYVNDEQEYPEHLAGLSGMPLVQVPRSSHHPTGIAFTPALHVDEMGLTSEKYIPINATLTSLPLRISYDRNDMEHEHTASTATAGGISPARWRLLTHFSEAIEQQSQLGFEQSDIDDLRRLVADTNITLLAITMLASALHLLFEFLTFKSEVSFWNKNTDLTGLSVRSLFLDMFGQFVILLFLIEKDSSLLMTVPSAIGVLIALWKCQKAAGLKFVKADKSQPSPSWYNKVISFTGYELRATRLDAIKQARESNASTSATEARQRELSELTDESDRIATKTLGVFMLPLVFGYTTYSLLYEEHSGWYSWLITSASSAVYALGFILMTPQLFLNWKLKSVAHLPWRVLVYKSLNTFIDDLFSFIIRMPTMARISCFRDDIVFFIYLYQRWLYPVDTSRPAEGGGEASTTDKKKTE